MKRKFLAVATALSVATGAAVAQPAQAQAADTSSVNEGYVVAVGTGLLAAALTIGGIVASDVRGANKIIGAYNRETGSNVSDLQQPFPEYLGH